MVLLLLGVLWEKELFVWKLTLVHYLHMVSLTSVVIVGIFHALLFHRTQGKVSNVYVFNFLSANSMIKLVSMLLTLQCISQYTNCVTVLVTVYKLNYVIQYFKQPCVWLYACVYRCVYLDAFITCNSCATNSKSLHRNCLRTHTVQQATIGSVIAICKELKSTNYNMHFSMLLQCYCDGSVCWSHGPSLRHKFQQIHCWLACSFKK